MTVTCKVCLEPKTLDELEKNYYNPSKPTKTCKSCRKGIQAKYKTTNAEKIKAGYRNYYHKNKEKFKTYHEDNRDKLKTAATARSKERRATDPVFALKHKTRTLIKQAYKTQGFKKKTKTQDTLCCTQVVFNAHLINTALNTYGFWLYDEAYHLDHIIPVSSARTEEDMLALNHYSNFQLLTPKDNIRKRDRDQPVFTWLDIIGIKERL